jgi:hypothetical protein
MTNTECLLFFSFSIWIERKCRRFFYAGRGKTSPLFLYIGREKACLLFIYAEGERTCPFFYVGTERACLLFFYVEGENIFSCFLKDLSNISSTCVLISLQLVTFHFLFFSIVDRLNRCMTLKNYSGLIFSFKSLYRYALL